MSDEARELLVYGVAAANANDRDEARFYLEWVLRIDADLDQETEAWYYLSKITDDPVEKRKCLENVLAADPNQGEARRDLAILEGRLKVEDMVNPFQEVKPLAPKQSLTEEDLKKYKCPRCGGRMTYDLIKGGLYCQFCGYSPSDATTAEATPASKGKDWIVAMYSERGHRWELPTARTFTCQSCGASVAVPPSQVSTSCPFCDTPHVIVAEESRELLQPDGVVPFALDAAGALGCARSWLQNQRFRPDDLSDQATFTPPRPVYLPFWTFDINCEVHWSGVAVNEEYGRAVEVLTSGSVPVMYDQVLVPGTTSLATEQLSTLSFDTAKAKPYSPDLLARWPTEVYSVSMSDAAVIAHEQAHDQSIKQLRLNLMGEADMVQGLKVDRTEISIISYKLFLLPIWVTEYTYEGKQYQVVLNGQSGQAHGDVPRGGLQRLMSGLFGGKQ